MKRVKQVKTIYFTTVQTQNTVHAGCLGFTHTLYPWVIAVTPEAARAAILKHFEKLGVPIEKVSDIRPALLQNIDSYTFPEQIIR